MGPLCSSAETQVCHRSYIIAANSSLSITTPPTPPPFPLLLFLFLFPQSPWAFISKTNIHCILNFNVTKNMLFCSCSMIIKIVSSRYVFSCVICFRFIHFILISTAHALFLTCLSGFYLWNINKTTA